MVLVVNMYINNKCIFSINNGELGKKQSRDQIHQTLSFSHSFSGTDFSIFYFKYIKRKIITLTICISWCQHSRAMLLCNVNSVCSRIASVLWRDVSSHCSLAHCHLFSVSTIFRNNIFTHLMATERGLNFSCSFI